MERQPYTIIMTDKNGRNWVMDVTAEDIQKMYSASWEVVKEGGLKETRELSNGVEFFVGENNEFIVGELSDAMAGKNKE